MSLGHVIVGGLLYARARRPGQHDVVHDPLVHEGCGLTRGRGAVRVPKDGHVRVPRPVFTRGIHAVEEACEADGSLVRVHGGRSLEFFLRGVVPQVRHHRHAFSRLGLELSVLHQVRCSVVVGIQRVLDVRVQSGHDHAHVVRRVHVALGDDRLEVTFGGIEAQQLAGNTITFAPSLRINERSIEGRLDHLQLIQLMLELCFLLPEGLTHGRGGRTGNLLVKLTDLSGQVLELLVQDDPIRLVPRRAVNAVKVADLLRIVLDEPLLVGVALVRPPRGDLLLAGTRRGKRGTRGARGGVVHVIVVRAQAEGRYHPGQFRLQRNGLCEDPRHSFRDASHHLQVVRREVPSRLEQTGDEGDDASGIDVDRLRREGLLDVGDVGANVVDAVDSGAGDFTDADEVVDLLIDHRDTLREGSAHCRDGLAAPGQGVQPGDESFSRFLELTRVLLSLAPVLGERLRAPLKNVGPVHSHPSERLIACAAQALSLFC